MASGALSHESELCQQSTKSNTEESNTASQGPLNGSSYRGFLDLIDQDLPIAEVVEKHGPDFDMAVENVLDDLGVVRTYLDDMMISTIGSNPPVSQDVDRQLQEASCACNKTLTQVQGSLVPLIQELQELLRTKAT